jgi:hypothetical protein
VTLARISIEAGAWTDPRFAMLARYLGLADAEHALIRCARVWAWQTERFTPDVPTYVVTAELLETLMGPGSPAALVRAGLAEELPDGFRIRGSEGRIEWLANRRRSAVMGGRARQVGTQVGSKRARRDKSEHGSGSYAESHMATHLGTQVASQMDSECGGDYNHDPHGLPHASHVPSQNPALLSGSGSDLQNRAHARSGSGPAVAPVHPEHPDPDRGGPRDLVQLRGRDPRAEEQGRLLRVIGKAHHEAHTRLRRDLGFDAPGRAGYVPAMQPLGDPAERALRDLVAAQASVDGLEERLRHVLAVGESEARRDGSLRWFGPTLWSERSYARAISMAVGEDRRPARSAAQEGPTAQALRRVRELEALEAEEERNAVDAGAL